MDVKPKQKFSTTAIEKAKQKARYLLNKKENSRYNFKSFNGFQPEKNANLLFSCSANVKKSDRKNDNTQRSGCEATGRTNASLSAAEKQDNFKFHKKSINRRKINYDPDPHIAVDISITKKQMKKENRPSNLTILQENLFMAAKKNQITYIQKNYDRFTLADFDVKDNLGNTAIYYATQYMQLNVLRLLIECGADVNLRCELGNTALHIAMMVGYRIVRNIPIIQTLIGAKANVKIKNLYG